jgi:hypothetical protein
MPDYDVKAAFENMELELIDSMKRNLSKHQKWETDEGINWTMWQVEQLRTLERFKKNNQKIFDKKFTSVNSEIAKFIKKNYERAGFEQEKIILDALGKGKKVTMKSNQGLQGVFFNMNEDKMNALIKATTNDMEKAEYAMLRMTNDQYRKTIFNAEVMANSGAFTLQQFIDKATDDFLKAGINCIEYKDGRRVNIASYAEMCIRTATKRAMLISEGEARNAYGIHTVRISRYGQCSPTCLPWQGKVYVDDVYSGGTQEEAKEKNLKLLSEAMAGGLFHPNCKHRSTTYFYDLKKSQGKLKDDGVENPPEEQEHRKNQKHIQQQKRLEIGSLDPKKIEQAKERKEQWIEKDNKLDLTYKTTDNSLKNVENNAINDTIVSGARITDIYSKEAQEFAESYYNEIRSYSTDCEKISLNTGIELEKIEQIKSYLFIDESLYNPATGHYRRFDADCAIAQTWQRLMLGKDIKKHDYTLLNHELYEMELKKNLPTITHNDAHTLASNKYNYKKEAIEYYGNLKKRNNNK